MQPRPLEGEHWTVDRSSCCEQLKDKILAGTHGCPLEEGFPDQFGQKKKSKL